MIGLVPDPPAPMFELIDGGAAGGGVPGGIAFAPAALAPAWPRVGSLLPPDEQAIITTISAVHPIVFVARMSLTIPTVRPSAAPTTSNPMLA